MKLFISLLLFALPAFGAVDVTVTPGDWPMYRGSTIIPPRHATLEACVAAVKALNAPRTYYCKTTVTVVATTAVTPPPPPPPPTETWTQCAVEDALCAFTGTRRVRYGADTRWVTRDIVASAGGVQCSNAVFGDPAPYTIKRCDLSNVVITPEPSPTGTGTATLLWNAPTLNTDGSTLTNLAGFVIRYGTQQITTDAAARSRVISGLPAGTYDFTVSAINSVGIESVPAGPARKVIP